MKGFRDFIKPTLHYLMETEVHVYGFSIAANVLLSFYPFLIVVRSLCRYTLHWPAAETALQLALNDYFPDTVALFVWNNLALKKIEWLSLLLLLFTANGVFEPLEVALNRAWGITKNRSFVKNQLISYGLIFACGAMAILSTTLTAANAELIRNAGLANQTIAALTVAVIFKMVAVPVMIGGLFLVYYVLPNGKVPRNRILVASIVVALLLEILKYVQLLIWPWFFAKLSREYGPFKISVSIILLSFFASMLVLAGAEWASRPARLEGATVPEPEPPPVKSILAI